MDGSNLGSLLVKLLQAEVLTPKHVLALELSLTCLMNQDLNHHEGSYFSSTPKMMDLLFPEWEAVTLSCWGALPELLCLWNVAFLRVIPTGRSLSLCSQCEAVESKEDGLMSLF